MSKFWKWALGLIALGLLYNVDAFIGQWKFERLCENEGGSKFYARVEKDVGWEVESTDDKAYQVPFNIGYVTFVRYRDKQGNLLDVYLTPGPTPWSKGYDIQPADMARQPKYRLTTEQGLLPDDERMDRVRYTITEVQGEKKAATHTSFGYSWTKSGRVILNAPTGVVCHAGHEVDVFFAEIFNTGSHK